MQFSCLCRSVQIRPRGQGGFDRLGSTKDAVDLHRVNGSERQFDGHGGINAEQTDHLDGELFAGISGCFQILARVVVDADGKGALDYRLFYGIGMGGEKIPNGSAQEIGAAAIEPLFDQQVNLAILYI